MLVDEPRHDDLVRERPIDGVGSRPECGFHRFERPGGDDAFAGNGDRFGRRRIAFHRDDFARDVDSGRRYVAFAVCPRRRGLRRAAGKRLQDARDDVLETGAACDAHGDSLSRRGAGR